MTFLEYMIKYLANNDFLFDNLHYVYFDTCKVNTIENFIV